MKRLLYMHLRPRSMYAYTVVEFLRGTLLWTIREVEVVQQQYTDIYDVADKPRMKLRCIPMSAERVAGFLAALIHVDDWVDILHLDGSRVRNVQRRK